MLERYFQLSAHGTTARTELMAGITTFLTMAYIIFVNPDILSAAGMPREAVFVSTCLAAALGSAIMGLYANYPIALAPAMGLNAYFAFTVVGGMHFPWQTALGAVFISGCLFVLISLFRLREAIVNAIPRSLKYAISAGIGLFLAIIGLKNAGLITAHPATLLTLGDLHQPGALLAIGGFILILALEQRRVPGAIIISILAVTATSMLLGLTPFNGIVAMPPSIAPTFLQMDLEGAFHAGLLTVVMTFFLVELFDASGTLIGVCHRAGLLDAEGRLPRLKKALLADSGAILAGAALGTSSTTAYIESAAGTSVGGRTGLTAVVVALLFLAALFLAPLAGVVPAYATAPALCYVAVLMVRGLAEIDWDDLTESAPAVVTAITMPFTFSIAHGIAFGFITYAALKLLSGRQGDLKPMVVVIALAFVLKFALL
ncbi:NCS2 family permease [Azospira sp. APE16]|jgi:AGZA family xanthine/uracil permease-like MFS transporter|uniref:Permease n=1 Tax=Azospira oryzae (strain ATCC BAA-33 / DSM 13638 / PS) TaxID=640081 RepID=G8QPF4_AZOOP|nr:MULTISPECIES: NCS2 family permease [Azospira]TLS19671.1 MAG: NCS2 family permease [Betaproteobacteria bacterium]AEV27055.1 permease [Azospira oryzae PS]MBP7489198.1 NCS2 family permease [Azospira sp.]MDK9691515.1 NCS2 family permease [Azospira sp.]BBN87582.1 transporter [Azospira sp. I09]